MLIGFNHSRKKKTIRWIRRVELLKKDYLLWKTGLNSEPADVCKCFRESVFVFTEKCID